MSDVKKAFLAAVAVTSAAGALVLGASHRNQVDLSGSTEPTLDGLLVARGGQFDSTATAYFHNVAEKLKEAYVEPVDDEMKLATGAVRGMVGSLADPRSLYMTKEEFRAFLNARQGVYEGIGADLVLQMTSPNGKSSQKSIQPTASEDEGVDSDEVSQEMVPRLVVASVVPGGPADKAGVKKGDAVDTVDGHWVYNARLLAKFRVAQKQFNAKKISLAEMNELRTTIRKKYEKAVLPLRARNKLVLGKGGTISVVWDRGGVMRNTSITKGVSKRAGFVVQGETIALPLAAGDPARLKTALEGKTAIKLDLRDNTLGDYGVMKKCLSLLVPKGDYGVLSTQRKGSEEHLRVSEGNDRPPKITVITDSSTRGAAEILALALSSKGKAKLEGSATGGDRSVIDVIQLPDGSGYTLATAVYKASPTLSTTALSESATAKRGSR